MFPLLSSIITGGAGLLGSMFSSSSAQDMNQQNIQAQMATNASNQAFTERMSNTAYQRSVADMKAAGLNPIAMFSSGSGGPASSPQGSQVAPRATENPGKAYEGMSKVAAEAVNSAVQMKTMDKMAEEIANLKQDNLTKEWETTLRRQQVLHEVESTGRTREEKERLAALKPVFTSEADRAAMLAELYRNNITRKTLQAGELGSAAKNAMSPVMDIGHLLTGSALRKYGIDKLAESMRQSREQGKHSHTLETWGKDWREITRTHGE